MAYGAIDHSFWTTGPARELLNDLEKLAFIYLLSSPHGNVIGFYRLPLAYMAEDLNWTRKEVEKVLKRLCAEETGPLVLYDYAAGVVLVPSHLKYNPLWKGNRETGAISQVKALPRTPLYHEFAKMLEVHAPELVELAAVVESVKSSVGSLRLFERSAESPAAVAVTDTDTVTATEKVQWFETFWKIYPKKRGKGAAEKSFAKAVTSRLIYETVMEGLEKHLGCADWVKDKGQYIPNPATWLNQRRWEDEPHSPGVGTSRGAGYYMNAGGHDPQIYEDAMERRRLEREAERKEANDEPA